MTKILSFEENKTFTKSYLLDLCTYLSALPNLSSLRYYFKIKFYWLKCLVIVVACFITEVYDS